MLNVIVCDGDEAERRAVMDLVRRAGTDKGVAVSAEGCADWEGLAGRVLVSEPDVVVVAQDGVEGLDTVTSAGALAGRIVWFSDLDFGVQAYRLCVSYFGKKPVTPGKIERALDRFWRPGA